MTFDVNPLYQLRRNQFSHFEHEAYEWKAKNKKNHFVHIAHYSAPVDILTPSMLVPDSHIHVKQSR